MSRNDERGTLNAEHRKSRRFALSLRSSFSVQRSAFTLTEVMFAVIVMGIGFIMIAAIFPVSISQTRLTVDETAAAANARAAMATATNLAAGGDTGTTAPLLPTTDLLLSPPATAAASAAALLAAGGSAPTPPAFQQVTVTGKVLSFDDIRLDARSAGTIDFQNNLWNAFKGSLISSTDSRYAWVPLYRRDVTYYNNGSTTIRIPSPFAQIYFIPVAVRNRSTYQTDSTKPDYDLNAGTATIPGNLVPRRLLARILPELTATSGYVIAFDDLATAASPSISAVSENAFVIISDDKINAPVVANAGRMNGRVYRIGTRRSDLDGAGAFFTNGANIMQVWELSPGGDFTKDTGSNGLYYDVTNNPTDPDDIIAVGNDTSLTNSIRSTLGLNGTATFSTASGPAEVFVIGRNQIGAGSFEGVSQDVSAFVTFIKVN